MAPMSLITPAALPHMAPRSAGIGLEIPEREADCTGARPSWYPFQINVCDAELDPADRDLTGRERSTDPAEWT
jgi:hypothetical protein